MLLMSNFPHTHTLSEVWSTLAQAEGLLGQQDEYNNELWCMSSTDSDASTMCTRI
jgi:hypothetical protein